MAQGQKLRSETLTESAEISAADLERTERIVFVTRSYGDGGAEKHLRELIERLDPFRFEVVVLTMGLDPFTPRFRSGGQPGVRVAAGPPSGNFAVSLRFFRSLRPDVIVFVNNEMGVFHWRMFIAARLCGARRVVEIEHSSAPPPDRLTRNAAPQSRWKVLAESIGHRLRRSVTTRLPGLMCHATICVSDATREILIRGYRYPGRKTITLLNGVDLRWFARNAETWPSRGDLLGREERGPVAVCVAALVPCKRIDLLLQAMKKIVEDYPRSCCVLVGGGPLESSLRAASEELGLARNVVFAGKQDDVRPYLAAADAFVLPSELEGLPLAVLEAMAFGLACVVADVGGNREAVQDGVNGFVVPAGSAEALADALSRLFADPDLRARMGRASRRVVEEKFDLESAMANVKSEILGLESVA